MPVSTGRPRDARLHHITPASPLGTRIQYATSATGESIACCVLGDGPPLVVVPSGPWTTIQTQQQVAAWWSWNTRLAARRSVVLYDLGGTGLSGGTSEGPRFGLNQQIADLKGVLTSLALPPVALFAAQFARMQQIAWQDAPYVALFNPHGIVATRANVHGFLILPTVYHPLDETWKE